MILVSLSPTPDTLVVLRDVSNVIASVGDLATSVSGYRQRLT